MPLIWFVLLLLHIVMRNNYMLFERQLLHTNNSELTRIYDIYAIKLLYCEFYDKYVSKLSGCDIHGHLTFWPDPKLELCNEIWMDIWSIGTGYLVRAGADYFRTTWPEWGTSGIK